MYCITDIGHVENAIEIMKETPDGIARHHFYLASGDSHHFILNFTYKNLLWKSVQEFALHIYKHVNCI